MICALFSFLKIDIERLLISDPRMHGSFQAGFVAVLCALAVGCVGCTERSSSPPSSSLSLPPTVPTPTEPEVVVLPPPTSELKELPPVETDNKSMLVATDGTSVVLGSSSTYPGWPMSNATDGNIQTSWYSNTNDSAAKGATPFFQIEFRKPTTVHRVTILGNRDPTFLRGYTVLSGRLDLIDARERVVASMTSAGLGNRRDFDFRLEAPIPNISIVRFTSLSDEGDKNPYGDVAIAEFQVE